MALVLLEYIEVDTRGVARINGKRSKVIQIVMDKETQGWSPEEIHEHYPHLTLSEIHAAFAYYYDHKEECDRQIQESIEFAGEMYRESQNDPQRKMLQAIKESRK